MPSRGRAAPRRFVLAGLSRLTVRVARLLEAEVGTRVAVVAGVDGRELLPLLPSGVTVFDDDAGLEAALRAAGAGASAAILALDDDDRANLRCAVVADAVAPGVPLVVRSFDPVLAARLEEGTNLRRAYSVSGLAAPAFVAAALADRVIHTLRLGDAEVPLLQLRVTAGSPLAGADPAVAESRHEVAVVSRNRGAGWGSGPEPLIEGEEVVVGGELHQVLRLAVANADLPRPRRRPSLGGEIGAGRSAGPTLVPWIAGALLTLLAANVLVFSLALELGPVDAIYFSVTTAFGDPGLAESQSWLKVFGVGSMLAGAAMIGVLFTQVASIATANRLETRMGKRARRLSGHAIVVGLGTVGYRIERLLAELGISTVVVEREHGSRFAEAVSERSPVLVGDVRVLENLERAGAGRASMLFGCTDDDLANIGACLQARRLHPQIRAVARVFDEDLAERGREAFGLHGTISASTVAAAAFAGAAIDEFARRSFELGEPWLALRWTPPEDVPASRVTALRGAGVRVVAREGADGTAIPGPAHGDALAKGAAVIVVGPAAAVEELVGA